MEAGSGFFHSFSCSWLHYYNFPSPFCCSWLHYYTTTLLTLHYYITTTNITVLCVSKRRKQLGWSVPGDDAEAFKRAVFVKWGKLRRVLGDELAQAMRNYVANHLDHTHTQKPAQVSAPHSTMFKRAATIFDRLKQAIKPDLTSSFTEAEFNRAIKIVAKVADPRTLHNYRSLLRDLGWIEQDSKTLKYRIRSEAHEEVH